MTLWLLIAAWVLLVLVLRWHEDRPRRPVEGKPDYKKIAALEVELAVGPCPDGYEERIVEESDEAYGRPGGVVWIRQGPLGDRILKDAWSGPSTANERAPVLQWSGGGRGHRVGVFMTGMRIENCHFDDSGEEMVF